VTCMCCPSREIHALKVRFGRALGHNDLGIKNLSWDQIREEAIEALLDYRERDHHGS